MKRKQLNTREGRGAFTLIELLICISLVGLLSASLAGYIVQLNQVRARADARAESFAIAEAFTRRWRDDVRLARKIELGADGTTLDLEMAAARVVRYALEEGAVKRSESSGATPSAVVAPDVKKLEFKRAGRGVQMTATRRAYDGLRHRDQEILAVATPLTALGAGGE